MTTPWTTSPSSVAISVLPLIRPRMPRPTYVLIWFMDSSHDDAPPRTRPAQRVRQPEALEFLPRGLPPDAHASDDRDVLAQAAFRQTRKFRPRIAPRGQICHHSLVHLLDRGTVGQCDDFVWREHESRLVEVQSDRTRIEGLKGFRIAPERPDGRGCRGLLLLH